MTAPVRIQLRRSRGWRMPAGAVKVDRTTPFGNPFRVGVDGTREDCVRLHGLLLVRAMVRHRVESRPVLPDLSWTTCGIRFVATWHSTRDTRHHQPATSRCGGCGL